MMAADGAVDVGAEDEKGGFGVEKEVAVTASARAPSRESELNSISGSSDMALLLSFRESLPDRLLLAAGCTHAA